MLVLGGHDLLLAPGEERAVIMQGDDGRTPFRLAFGQQKIRRDADVGRRVEVDLLADVGPAVDALDDLSPRITFRRGVLQQAEHLGLGLAFPRRHILEPLLQERERHGRAARGGLEQGVQAADLGVRNQGAEIRGRWGFHSHQAAARQPHNQQR